MSFLSAITSLFSGSAAVSIGGISLTGAQAKQGFSGLQKAWPVLSTAVGAKLANLPADADAAEAILDVIASLKIPEISQDALLGEYAIKVAVLIFTNNRSALPGAQLPPWAGGSQRRGS